MATLFVSPFGRDDWAGTLDKPFCTIEQGIASLDGPGDILFLRGGSYAENVEIAGLKGTASAPILIRAYGREHVTIDGAEPPDVHDRPAGFRVGGNHEWKLAIEVDPDAHEEEYISVRTFPTGSEEQILRHGAFLDRDPYTRLITYSRLEDLRAVNQTFGRLPLDHPLPPFPGFPVVKVDDDGNVTPESIKQPDDTPIDTFKRPWVYMGPGLFFDADGRIHIRLSHTTNYVPGVVDYDGGTDPRQVRLAISRYIPPPLVVDDCEFVHLDHLDVRFGGDRTVHITDSDDVVFDHVRVFAGSDGIRVGENSHRLEFRHCAVLGGIPTWTFRSDLKDGYDFEVDGTVFSNRLGAGTSQKLFSSPPPGAGTNVDTVVHHCEFVDGHDLAMFGQGTRFHHNWIHNVNDDALIVDIAGTSDLEISENAVMRSLTALSFALPNLGGSRKVHRNLIDLRDPTAGIRPRPCGHLVDKDDENKDGSVFRFGQLYKGDDKDGALDLFHNTCLVMNQTGHAGFRHYRSSEGETRRALNNIFVDAGLSPDRPGGYATSLLPAPGFRGPTDANCYFQLFSAPGDVVPLLRHFGYPPDDPQEPFDSFKDLVAYRLGDGQNTAADAQPNKHFDNSKVLYPPGFEEDGIDLDPQLRRIAPDGVPQFDDDLRFAANSPARGKGRTLSDPEIGIDDPQAPAEAPDLGCYQFDELDQPGLRVGVDERRRFPESDEG
jgi:hypothetical protein